MEGPWSHTDPGWRLSPVSELSSSMQSLRCQDSLTPGPRRRLQLTPELNSPDGGPSGAETPTVSRRKCYRKLTSPELTSDLCDLWTQGLTGDPERDEDDEDDKENNNTRRKVRVRLFSPSSPEESPAERDMKEPDPRSLMLFQRLRSRRKASDPPVPYSGVIDQYLIGDFSKSYALPVEKVDHQDLHCVSAQTVADLIGGQFGSVVEDFLIVDCRYPYEYDGGHIKGAVNLYTEAQIRQAFLRVESPGSLRGAEEVEDGGSSARRLIVFHCEFSTERGPRLCQYLRKLDRDLHAQAYPHLLYPELYMLQGGYKRFHARWPELCEPAGYVPMRHRSFREQFRRFSGRRRSHRRRSPERSRQTPAHTFDGTVGAL
ncbi:cell division cycle 25 homolog d isoform X2 [Trichomycterus rosablanca]|uniref:cell division cycle 25 homolog d isoform X2 n=1 Tax=Trichomycterus rosablanca TaxID=2290929 RepID=UPI002F35C354